MFSVNIDKIAAMTETEEESIGKIADAIDELCEGKYRTIGIVGEPKSAFKIACTMAKNNKKVLFIDADAPNDAFLRKYRLGKNLKGFLNYVLNEAAIGELICRTNRDEVDIIFTGECDEDLDMDNYQEEIMSLLSEFSDKYNMVVVAAGQDEKICVLCSGTIFIMKDSEYTQDRALAIADEFENSGCNVLGVIVDEQ